MRKLFYCFVWCFTLFWSIHFVKFVRENVIFCPQTCILQLLISTMEVTISSYPLQELTRFCVYILMGPLAAPSAAGEYTVEWCSEWWIGRKLSWPNRDTILEFPWRGRRKQRNTSVNITDVPTEIPTEYLPSTSPDIHLWLVTNWTLCEVLGEGPSKCHTNRTWSPPGSNPNRRCGRPTITP